MNALQTALVEPLRAQYALANPVGKVSILGRVCDVLGGSVGAVVAEQGLKGYPDPMLRALARVIFHA